MSEYFVMNSSLSSDTPTPPLFIPPTFKSSSFLTNEPHYTKKAILTFISFSEAGIPNLPYYLNVDDALKL